MRLFFGALALLVLVGTANAADPVFTSPGGYHFDHVDHVHFIKEIPDGMRIPLHAPDHDCELAEKAAVSAQVLVEYTVNADGTVSDVVVKDVQHDGQMVVFNWAVLQPAQGGQGGGLSPDDAGTEVASDTYQGPGDSGSSGWQEIGVNPIPWEEQVAHADQDNETLPDDEWRIYFAAQAMALIDQYEFEEADEATKGQQMIMSFNFPCNKCQVRNQLGEDHEGAADEQ